jgi:YbbR domain-containing protein
MPTGPLQRGKKWLTEVFLDNLPLKILCLLVSLLAYSFLHGAQNAQRVFSVSVVRLLPETSDQALLTDLPATVRVTLGGSRLVLDELRAEDLGSVQLDLRKPNGAFGVFDTTALKIPAGLTPTVDPPRIPLRWDTLGSRTIPVQTSVAGQPAAGFAVQSGIASEPRFVQAQGPRTILETLQVARVEPFDVSGLGEGVHTRRLVLDPAQARVQYAEKTVLVTVTIARARLERVFTGLAVHATGVARATTVPAQVDVRVIGPPEQIDALRPDHLVPTVDVRSVAGDTRSGAQTVPVTLQVEGCSVQVSPPSVVVKW